MNYARVVSSKPLRFDTLFNFNFVKFQAARVIPDSRPSRDWPQQGVVLFDNFQLRYRDGLPLVLKEISFMIKPAEKVELFNVLKISFFF